MKKFTAFICVLSLALLCCACSSSPENTGEALSEETEAVTGESTAFFEETTEAQEAKTTEAEPSEAKITETKAPETKAPETKAPETKAPETKTPETEAPKTEAPVATSAENSSGEHLVGVSANGFEILEINGITYIDGIMVVNKTYSVPSTYAPGGLLPECDNAFREMAGDASLRGLSLYVSSGFRSFDLQSSLYSRYCNRDGKAAADTYSARAGHSEHQTGLAIDLNTITSAFADTAEGRWVAENCYKYGFILRYPKGKEAQTGYMYEPWHIRYVGKALAQKIWDSGLCLEEYFGITSEYAT